MKRTRTNFEMHGDFRVTEFNDGSVAVQYLAKGEIISINDKTPAGTNVNENEYFIATVKANVQGTEETSNAIIWGNQLHSDKLAEGTWAPGAPVLVAITDKNITPDGEIELVHRGKASIELMGAKGFSEVPTFDGADSAILSKFKNLNLAS